MAKFAKEHLQGLSKTETAVLLGSPDKEIVAYADKHKATMIVMTTHGYSGVKHLVLGSTTEAVLRQANCPVLSVKAKS
jgi:universal stress protein A